MESPVDTNVPLIQKIKDYSEFMKLRLAALVVLSSGICYGVAADQVSWRTLGMLLLGGSLLTGASNGLNEVAERKLDALMDRTRNRPLPQNRMSVTEAMILACTSGAVSIALLWMYVNPMSGLLGALALLLYVAAYTPLKQMTPFAVFVGAIPGSIPPLLGCVAATDGFGHITLLGLLMFAVQFLWQFPHFWAIAWRLDDDYKKAGFKMLPSPGGRDRATAFQVVIYTIGLLPVSLLPYFFHFTGLWSAIFVSICGVVFIYLATRLFRSLHADDAKLIMFGSFLYLPLVQLAYLLDKV